MAGERILMVEDERAVARGLQYSLDKEGFDVLWARTGQQALDLAWVLAPGGGSDAERRGQARAETLDAEVDAEQIFDAIPQPPGRTFARPRARQRLAQQVGERARLVGGDRDAVTAVSVE